MTFNKINENIKKPHRVRIYVIFSSIIGSTPSVLEFEKKSQELLTPKRQTFFYFHKNEDSTL